ncbi:hypothetical protein [Aestuariibaculum sediminum]|uniref:Peptide-N(4)-(N-acetyl-beta-glucosaminyl)asparagine amidase n=1 Tax=Aestuariibaculum sediminum TaxID=2770637 RepID=A0A8J6UI25_9FLAO|nr:hypothetical protein [Aestuariibaculum sediminum]MBD0833716.1 hypothetical protein [Aestuariibaculum sediminum]
MNFSKSINSIVALRNSLVYIITSILFVFLFSCNQLPNEVEESLKLAGNNRDELQKVLDHYQKPEDSLKLRAAYFLISEQVPYGVFTDSRNDQLLNDYFNAFEDSLAVYFCKESDKNIEERKDIINSIIKKYQLNHGKVFRNKWSLKRDIHHITGAFLIENIDYAFKAWDLPWAKHYSFDEFCNYILPYREGKHYPNSWRKYFFEEFMGFRDSLGQERDPLVAAEKLKKYLGNMKFISGGLYDAPECLLSSVMYKYKITGNCVSISTFIQEVLRAQGIATVEVLVNKFGHTAKDHVSNGVLDNNGSWHYFDGIPSAPGSLNIKDEVTKLYRKKPIVRNELTQTKGEAFNHLNLFGWEDITKDLIDCYDISINLKDLYCKNLPIAYLCIFDNLSHGGWVPIDWGEIDKDLRKVTFKDIGGKEVVYLVMVYDEFNNLKPVSSPFVLKNDGAIDYLNIKRGVDDRREMIIDRKFSPKQHLNKIAKNLIEGRFEGANSPDFKKREVLYTLKNITDVNSKLIEIEPKNYQYYRFVFPKIKDSLYYDIAELGFGNLTSNSFRKENGDYISSKGINATIQNSYFDDDLLSYTTIYRKEGVLKAYMPSLKEVCVDIDKEVWIGIDLGSSKSISQLYLCPRTDKNSIYPKMDYELLYWDNRWVSTGIRNTNQGYLKYDDLPSNTLYWLRNYTEGKEERIFTYEDGKQIWW